TIASRSAGIRRSRSARSTWKLRITSACPRSVRTGFTPSSSNPSGAPSSSTRCPGLMPRFFSSGVTAYPTEDMERSLRVWYSSDGPMPGVGTEERVEAPPAAVEEPPTRAIAGSTLAAVAAVLAWYLIQLASYLGEAPDLDAMISLRESLVAHRDGLHGLIADR